VHNIESWSPEFRIRAQYVEHGLKLHPGEYSIHSGRNELCKCQIVQIGRPKLGRYIFDLSPFERCQPFYNHIMSSSLPLKDVSIRSLDANCPYGHHQIYFEIDRVMFWIYMYIRADTLISKESRSWCLYQNGQFIVTFSSCIIQDPIEGNYKIAVPLPDSSTILPHLSSLSDLYIERASPQ
jgi:hypothetical protein